MKILYQFFYLGIVIFLLYSCIDEQDVVQNNTINESTVKNFNPTEKFAIALAKVLEENKEARELVKTEALKKIDFDYDVLYHLVKDIPLGNDISLETLMQEHMDLSELNLLTDIYPTLTIFVPTLPENSFSAELWDTENQAPEVAIKPVANYHTPYYNAAGEKSYINIDEIPGFPIVVLKLNERIRVNNNKTNNQMVLRSSNSKYTFEFTDVLFDNYNSPINIKTRRGEYDKYTKSLESYNIFLNNLTGWQRDYVYYNITNEINRGPLDLRFKECIAGFELLGNPYNTIAKLSDQPNDPKLDGVWHQVPTSNPRINRLTPWSDGEFEFDVRIFTTNTINSENAIVNTTKMRIDPTHLFSVETDVVGVNKKYKILSIKNLYCIPHLPLFEWDLQRMGTTIRIEIAEYDPSEVKKSFEKYVVEFANNFEYSTTTGTDEKVGQKYGSSNKTSHEVTYEITTTYNSDELGGVLVNFGDEIILSNQYKLKSTYYRDKINIPDFNEKYATDYYRIKVWCKT